MKKVVYLGALLFFVAACSEENEETTKKVEQDIIVEDDNDDTDDSSEINDIVYIIPSPSDQFDNLREIGGDINTSFIHDLSKASEYSTKEAIALNFGVYSTDAIYMMRFDQGKKVFTDYISVLEKLSESLGISQIYGEELMAEIEDVQDDPDELYDISSDNYMEVYDKLIENDKGPELALLVAGGWIQTMHILFETAGSFDGDMLIQDFITNEQLVLENLKKFLSHYEDNERIADLLVDLKKLADIYNEMDCKSTELEVQSGAKKGDVLFGGASCVFTEPVYNKMHDFVEEIRDKIIS